MAAVRPRWETAGRPSPMSVPPRLYFGMDRKLTRALHGGRGFRGHDEGDIDKESTVRCCSGRANPSGAPSPDLSWLISMRGQNGRPGGAGVPR